MRPDIPPSRSSKKSRPAGKPQPSEDTLPSAGPGLERQHANARPAGHASVPGAGHANDVAADRPAGDQRPSRPLPATTSRLAMTQPTIPQTDANPERTAAPTLEIANAIAAAYKDVLGRGPNKTNVHFARPDTLVVVLESTMTMQERTLAALGEDKRLREHRLVLMTALEDRSRSIVERALGRRTLAFLSGIDTRRDVAVEVFTLEPDSTDRQQTTTRLDGKPRQSGLGPQPPGAVARPNAKAGPVKS